MSTAPARGTTVAGFRILGEGIRAEPRVFAVSVVGAVLFGGLTVADAWALGWATEHGITPALRDGEIGTGVLVAIAALFVGIALLRALGVIARRVGAGVMQYRLQAQGRRAVTRRYLALPMSWHQRHPTGQLLSTANSDVEATWGPIAPMPMALGTLAMMVIAVGQMLAADVVLALVGLLVFPAVITANLAFQRRSQGWAMRAQQLRAELSEVAHESFEGAQVVKTLGREPEETARFGAVAHELREANIRLGLLRAVFDPLMSGLPTLGVLLVLLVGVGRVEAGATSPADLVTVCYLLTVVAFPIRSLGWVLGEFPRSVVGHGRVAEVLAATGEMAFGTRRLPTPVRGDAGATLELRGVDYAYPGADTRVLRGIDLTVAPGRTVAVVGATASGKSTLTTLLSRLVDPDAGQVLLDGVDLRDLAPGELARAVAVVPQTAFIFDDTVRGNVTLGLDVADDDVWWALRTAQVDDVVAALDGGLDARLGERGASLSGGQRQRLALARALVRRPRLLVLDDATSAVDPEVEARILAGLRAQVDTTLVVVAYRKATIGLADEVVHLADGVVRERGTHADLVRRSESYARLVNAYEDARDDAREEVRA
ncbi:ABC transporter ATP-binding protein [Nocardioides sp.]|uniref:ABC transporter ATP-binding protein n=1 Tax=Nocardioides sp. TaxID=35761 RepID=UPI0035118247